MRLEQFIVGVAIETVEAHGYVVEFVEAKYRFAKDTVLEGYLSFTVTCKCRGYLFMGKIEVHSDVEDNWPEFEEETKQVVRKVFDDVILKIEQRQAP